MEEKILNVYKDLMKEKMRLETENGRVEPYSITRHGKTYDNIILPKRIPESSTEHFERVVLPILQGYPDICQINNVDDLVFLLKELTNLGIAFNEEILRPAFHQLGLSLQTLRKAVRKSKTRTIKGDTEIEKFISKVGDNILGILIHL
jgi:hypothetical protein